MSQSEGEEQPESDYTNVSVPDEELPEDLQASDDNPLAGTADDSDAERQDLGDPHILGLERDDDDHLTLRDSDSDSDTDEDGED